MTETKKTKPGYKTTEFWLSTIAVLLGAALNSGLLPAGTWQQVAGLVGGLLATLGYTASRAKAKG